MNFIIDIWLSRSFHFCNRISSAGSKFKEEDMYHFLSTNCRKLRLQNWDNYSLDPEIQEKTDYVLVSQKVWNSLQSTFGGGPEIQLFLTDNDNALTKYKISKDQNFIYHQPYLYGYPDKNPQRIECYLISEFSIDSVESMRIPYKLLVSPSITPKSLLYH